MSQLGRDPELSGEQHTGMEGLSDDWSPQVFPQRQHTAYTRVDGWLTLGTYYRDGLGFVSLPDPGPGKEQLLRGVGC